MRATGPLALSLYLSSSMSAQDVARVYFHCDLTHIEAQPSDQTPGHPLSSRRIPGAGAVVHAWENIIQTHTDVFTIEGVLCSDNAGFPMEGVTVFLGNLERSRTLRILGTSDKHGRFEVVIDNRTNEQILEAAAAADPPLYVIGMERDGPTREAIYVQHGYLYFGKSGVDLYQYRIPYEKAVAPQGEGSD